MKKLFFAWMGLSVLLLGACTDDYNWNGGGGTSPDPLPANTLRIRVGMEGMISQGAMTRADVNAETDEDKVESLFLLFFKSEAGNSGEFVDYLEIEDPSEPVHHIDMSGTLLKVTDPYHILAIANIHGEFGKHYLNGMDVPAWMLQWVGKTESQVIAEANAWTRSGMTVEPNQLLMSGRIEKAENQFDVTLQLVRNQVRFDVLSSLGAGYKVVSVEIRNAYSGSKIWNDGTEGGALDFSDDVSRIPIYYKFVNETDNPKYDEYGGDILGGLYVFENQVTMPTRNDRYTTCLIVELENLSLNTTTFYRINIAPNASPQMLKRNNAYRITLNNVGRDGSDDPEVAFTNPNDNQLDYTINIWDRDGEGVIVSDANSMLSAPYKTVTLPRAKMGEGNPPAESSVSTSFQIFTFTNNPNPVSPLEILGQTYSSATLDDGEYNIVASLSGNVLTVMADPISSGATVRGEIQLGYAGLRAKINVLQADQVTDFLQVHLPDGGIPRFAPFSDIQSGVLRVEASDTWTAELLVSNGGFTFKKGQGKTRLPSNPADPEYDGSLIVDGNKFSVWTMSPNALTTAREAFIIVTLDKDPENISQVIRIVQDAKAEIAIIPQHTVTFDGTGVLALIPNNSDQQFVVRPSQSTTEPPLFEAWEAVIDGPTGIFEVDDEERTADVDDPDGNFVHVRAVGKNTSGASYKAKLIVRLVNNPSVQTSIDLVQTSSGIDFSPNSVPTVPKTGGETQLIAVQADRSLQWKLLNFTVTDGSATKDPVNHIVKLMDQNGNEISTGTEYSVANDKFKVVFPKIYYPNRDIPISATVEIGIVGSTLKKSITVNQAPLTASAFSIAAPQTGGYGNIHAGSYNVYFRNGIRAMGSVSTIISAGSNMLYRNYEGLYAGYGWSVENNFHGMRDALTMIVSDEYAPVVLSGLNNPSSPLAKAGFTIAHSNGNLNASINTTVSGTKLYQLLVAGAAADIPAINNTNVDIYEDGVSTQATAFPSTTVPIIVSRGTNRAFLAIDPKLGLIYLGESQMFDTPAGNPFLSNLLVYIKNAAVYGSHFTDLLIDGGGTEPAPWDSAWGANAGVAK